MLVVAFLILPIHSSYSQEYKTFTINSYADIKNNEKYRFYLLGLYEGISSTTLAFKFHHKINIKKYQCVFEKIKKTKDLISFYNMLISFVHAGYNDALDTAMKTHKKINYSEMTKDEIKKEGKEISVSYYMALGIKLEADKCI